MGGWVWTRTAQVHSDLHESACLPTSGHACVQPETLTSAPQLLDIYVCMCVYLAFPLYQPSPSLLRSLLLPSIVLSNHTLRPLPRRPHVRLSPSPLALAPCLCLPDSRRCFVPLHHPRIPLCLPPPPCVRFLFLARERERERERERDPAPQDLVLPLRRSGEAAGLAPPASFSPLCCHP